jgi:hypothetical protein
VAEAELGAWHCLTFGCAMAKLGRQPCQEATRQQPAGQQGQPLLQGRQLCA